MGEATAHHARQGRLQHLRDPPRLPGGARPRRGGQGRHRRDRRRGAVHQHERRRRREAGRRASRRSASASPHQPRGRTQPYVRVVMHSLAFGSLVPFLSEDPKGGVDRKKMEMTQDVMANSLVYWVQDLWRGGLPRPGLEDLRDDLGGLDPRRAVVRRRVVGQGGARVARPPAGHGARPARHRRRPRTASGRA